MSLFIGNIPDSVSREDIIKEFSVFGKCDIEYFNRFAFCLYRNSSNSSEALKFWNDKLFHGNALKVEISQRKPKKTQKRSRTPSPEPNLRPSHLSTKHTPNTSNSKKLKSKKNHSSTYKINSKHVKKSISISNDPQDFNECISNPVSDNLTPEIIREVIDSTGNHLQLADPHTLSLEQYTKTPPKQSNIDVIANEVGDKGDAQIGITTPFKIKREPQYEGLRKSPEEIKSNKSTPKISNIVYRKKSESAEEEENKTEKQKISYIFTDENTVVCDDCTFKVYKRFKDIEKIQVKCGLCSRLLKLKSIQGHLKSKIHNASRA